MYSEEVQDLIIKTVREHGKPVNHPDFVGPCFELPNEPFDAVGKEVKAIYGTADLPYMIIGRFHLIRQEPYMELMKKLGEIYEERNSQSETVKQI